MILFVEYRKMKCCSVLFGFSRLGMDIWFEGLWGCITHC